MTAPATRDADTCAPNAPPGSTEPSPLFGRRLRNAIALLAVAVSLHVWIGRPPQGSGGDMVSGSLPHIALAQARPSSVRPLIGQPGAAAYRETDASGPLRRHENQERLESILLADEAPAASLGRIRIVAELVRVATIGGDGPAGRPQRRGAPGALPDRDVAPPRIPERFAGIEPPAEGIPGVLRAMLETARPDWHERIPAARAALAAVPPTAAASLTSAARTPALIADTASTAVDLERQKAHVRDVLEQYARAYERLDVAAALAVRPALNARDLERAFKGLAAQRLRLTDCDVAIDGRAANVHCRADATYRPKVGTPVRVTAGEGLFSLTRRDGGWYIVDAVVQKPPPPL